jgi:hypothetical protein
MKLCKMGMDEAEEKNTTGSKEVVAVVGCCAGTHSPHVGECSDRRIAVPRISDSA